MIATSFMSAWAAGLLFASSAMAPVMPDDGIVSPMDSESSAEVVPLRLSMAEAMLLAADQNLNARLTREKNREARGFFLTERADILPKLSAGVSQTRQKKSTAAFGLPEESVVNVGDTIPFDIAYPGLDPALIDRYNLPEEGNVSFEDQILLDYENADTTGPYNYFNGSLRLYSALYNGEDYSEYKAAKAGLDRSSTEILYAEEEAMSQSAFFYLSVIVQTKAREALISKIDLHEQKLAELTDLAEAGAATDLDVMQEDIALAKARNDLAAAERDLHGTVIEFIRFLNLPAGTEVEFTGDLSFHEVETSEPSAILEDVLEQRLDYRLQSQLEDIAELNREAAKKAYYPTVSAFGSYGLQGNDPTDTVEAWSIGAFASLPIWDFYDRKGRLEQKESQLNQVRYAREDMVMGIVSELDIARRNVSYAMDTVSLMTQTVAYAELKKQSEDDKLADGAGRRIDVLEAEVDLAQAEYKHLEALYNHEKARLVWLKATGNIASLALPRSGDPGPDLYLEEADDGVE